MRTVWLVRAAAVVLGLLAGVVARSAAAETPAPSGPQAEASVEGVVLDAVTSQPVVGARVSATGRAASSGRDGRFALRLRTGSHTLEVSAGGYQKAQVELQIGTGPTPRVEVLLVAEKTFSEEVDVVATGLVTRAPAELPVKPAEVMIVAGAADNIFRALQTLPGVAATDEFGSRLAVRGGGPDENLTIMDGVEVHNPYRLFGLTSAFNPEIVKSFDLYAGAFGVQYGDRLSSLLVVDNREGTRERAVAGSLNTSITDANVVMEGKLPGQATGSWLFTGRRTYYDLIANEIVDTELPSFTDLQGRVVYEPRPGYRLTLSGMLSRESADSEFDEDGDTAAFLTDTDNDLVNISLQTPLGSGGSSQTSAAWYRNGGTFDVNARFKSDDRRSNSLDDEIAKVPYDLSFSQDFEVGDLSLRQALLFQLARRHVVEAGFELHRIETATKFVIDGGRNPYEANGSSAAGGAGLPSELDSRVVANRIGGWLADRVTLGRLVVEPGLRYDWSGVNDRGTLSPRLSTTLRLGSQTRLRAALGLFTQSPGYEKLILADYFVDLSGVLDLESARATHYLLGFERDFGPGALLRVEGYYKAFDDITIGRMETEAERIERISAYAFPPELASSIPTAPQITSFPVDGGSGEAYGIDVYLTKKATSRKTRLSGWLAYTWSKARRESYGLDYPFDYDRPHALSLVAAWRAKNWLDVSATLRAASGFPRTPVVGIRVAAVDEIDASGVPTGRLVPLRDAVGLPVWEVDVGDYRDLNSERAAAFYRLDLRTTFYPGGRGGRWQLYLDLINATNHRNVAGYEGRLEADPDGDRPLWSEIETRSIPLLPSFGVRFQF